MENVYTISELLALKQAVEAQLQNREGMLKEASQFNVIKNQDEDLGPLEKILDYAVEKEIISVPDYLYAKDCVMSEMAVERVPAVTNTGEEFVIESGVILMPVLLRSTPGLKFSKSDCFKQIIESVPTKLCKSKALADSAEYFQDDYLLTYDQIKKLTFHDIRQLHKAIQEPPKEGSWINTLCKLTAKLGLDVEPRSEGDLELRFMLFAYRNEIADLDTVDLNRFPSAFSEEDQLTAITEVNEAIRKNPVDLTESGIFYASVLEMGPLSNAVYIGSSCLVFLKLLEVLHTLIHKNELSVRTAKLCLILDKEIKKSELATGFFAFVDNSTGKLLASQDITSLIAPYFIMNTTTVFKDILNNLQEEFKLTELPVINRRTATVFDASNIESLKLL